MCAQVIPIYALYRRLMYGLLMCWTNTSSLARTPLIWTLIRLRATLACLFLHLMILLGHNLERYKLIRNILNALLYLFILLEHFFVILHQLSL